MLISSLLLRVVPFCSFCKSVETRSSRSYFYYSSYNKMFTYWVVARVASSVLTLVFEFICISLAHMDDSDVILHLLCELPILIHAFAKLLSFLLLGPAL